MAIHHQILFGAVALIGAQLGSVAHARNAADVTTGPHSVVTAPLPALPEANGGMPGAEGQSEGGSESASAGASAPLSVGIIVETAPPTNRARTQPGYDTNDPFIERRVRRAQARADYRARVNAAREQYREEKRAANAELLEQQGWASGQ